ncbi:MAG: four helix bundle protein [Gemmatimonadaceae bacterium]
MGHAGGDSLSTLRVPGPRLTAFLTGERVKDFRKLAAWNKAHSAVLEIYGATKVFPAAERYGITSQLRRSSASVAANLAEGCARGSDLSFASFVQIAYSSASETQYHLLLANDLGMLDSAVYDDLSDRVSEIKRMLLALLRTLQKGAAQRHHEQSQLAASC